MAAAFAAIGAAGERLSCSRGPFDPVEGSIADVRVLMQKAKRRWR